MKKLRELLKKLKEMRAEVHEKWDTLTTKQVGEATAAIKAVGAELQAILTEGAKDCEPVQIGVDADGKPIMGEPRRPLGLFHEGTPNPFEVGDPVTGHRSRGAFLEDAVENWNEDKWLPPRAPETAVMTHRDAAGNVISQKEVKLQR